MSIYIHYFPLHQTSVSSSVFVLVVIVVWVSHKQLDLPCLLDNAVHWRAGPTRYRVLRRRCVDHRGFVVVTLGDAGRDVVIVVVVDLGFQHSLRQMLVSHIHGAPQEVWLDVDRRALLSSAQSKRQRRRLSTGLRLAGVRAQLVYIYGSFAEAELRVLALIPSS